MEEPEVGQWCRCTPKPRVGGGSFVGRVMEVGDGFVKLERSPAEGGEAETTTVSTDDYEIEADTEA